MTITRVKISLKVTEVQQDPHKSWASNSSTKLLGFRWYRNVTEIQIKIVIHAFTSQQNIQ